MRDFFFICRDCWNDQDNASHPLCTGELWEESSCKNSVIVHPPKALCESYGPSEWREAYYALRGSMLPFETKYIDGYIRRSDNAAKAAKKKHQKLNKKERSEHAKKMVTARELKKKKK